MQVDTISKAEQSKKIKDCNDFELAKALSVIYYLIGLRKQNFPTKEEDGFLFAYIRKNYGEKGIEELFIAFDFAIKGFYNFDVKVYDQFTIAYFVSIMEGYRKTKIERIKERILEKEIKELPVPKVTDDERKEEIEYWKNKKPNIRPVYLFDYLLKFKLIEWNNEIRNKFLKTAIDMRKYELEGNSDRDKVLELRDLKKMISEGYLEGDEKSIIINRAKRLVINDYYENGTSATN
jgi:hypothetical protein